MKRNIILVTLLYYGINVIKILNLPAVFAMFFLGVSLFLVLSEKFFICENSFAFGATDLFWRLCPRQMGFLVLRGRFLLLGVNMELLEVGVQFFLAKEHFARVAAKIAEKSLGRMSHLRVSPQRLFC